MSNLTFGAPPLIIVCGISIWAVGAWLCYQNWNRNDRRRAIGWLEGIRFLLITLLVFTFFKPEWVQQIKRTEKPEVLVLLDKSASMQTSDVVSSNGVATRASF